MANRCLLPISLAQPLSLLSRPKVAAFLKSNWLPSSLQKKQGKQGIASVYKILLNVITVMMTATFT